MLRIGPLIVMKASSLPFLKKAHKLAHSLSPMDVEALLAGKKHIHSNPIRKEKKSEPQAYEGGN